VRGDVAMEERNIAKHGSASQSSTRTYGEAWRAVDGNKEATWREDNS